MTAYYNEIDPYAAQWLRNLIKAGHIAPGDVDERSIEDVKPSELAGYTQCHFFAGIGVWSLALRQAGWSDNHSVWTGSCPCQPFSAAGAGAGFADERHLWPAMFHLIEQCKPAIVLGEQVASKDAEPWIDLVQTDLEALGYAVGAVAFPSASVGAPHIRDRLYWVGNASSARLEGHAGDGGAARRKGQVGSVAEAGVSGGVGHSNGQRTRRDSGSLCGTLGRENGQHSTHHADASSAAIGLVNTKQHSGGCQAATSPTNGFWRDADWLLCRDGKWRPVEPGTFPLVNGAASRVGRLRAYGNAINAEAAQAFIEVVMEYLP